MEAILLCLMLNKLHLRSRTKNAYILPQIVTLYLTYTFRPVHNPSSDMYVNTKVL
jgi:hypothetical protein